MRRLLIKDGKAINVIELPDGWPGKAGEWPLPAGCTLIDDSGFASEPSRPDLLPRVGGQIEHQPVRNVSTPGLPTIRNGYCRVDVFETLEIHSHEGQEGFIIVVSGSPRIQLGDTIYDSISGDIFSFSVGEQHGIESGRGTIVVFHVG